MREKENKSQRERERVRKEGKNGRRIRKIKEGREKDKKKILILVETPVSRSLVLRLSVCNTSYCHKSFVFVVCDSKGQRTTKESFQMEYDLSFIM